MRVHILDTGKVQIHRRQVEAARAARVLATLADRRWTDWLPVWSFAIEHPGGVVVVDCGQDPDFAPPAWDVYTRTAVRFDAVDADRLDARLREAGLSVDDVTHHVFTHLHVDHIGTGPLPGQAGVVSDVEWKAATAPTGRLGGLLTTGFTSPTTVALPHDLLGDGTVRLIATPGHTAGHLSVLVDGGEGPRVLLAGDAVYTEAQLLDGRIDGVAASARRARETVRSLQALCREAPTVVCPTHDPGSVERLATLRPTAP